MFSFITSSFYVINDKCFKKTQKMVSSPCFQSFQSNWHMSLNVCISNMNQDIWSICPATFSFIKQKKESYERSLRLVIFVKLKWHFLYFCTEGNDIFSYRRYWIFPIFAELFWSWKFLEITWKFCIFTPRMRKIIVTTMDTAQYMYA